MINGEENQGGERTTVPKSISMPAETLKAGMAKARAEGRSFSNYMARLIEQDTKEVAASAGEGGK